LEEVKIFINAYHTGTWKTGTGTYTVVLEHFSPEKGIKTKELIDGYTETTKNRIALLASIAALRRMLRPCKIILAINSNYLINAIDNGNWLAWLETGKTSKRKPVKNLDLWQQLYDLAMIHEMEFVFMEKNSYSDYMLREMQRKKIELKEDKQV
jgi:ribonuclease HI